MPERIILKNNWLKEAEICLKEAEMWEKHYQEQKMECYKRMKEKALKCWEIATEQAIKL